MSEITSDEWMKRVVTIDGKAILMLQGVVISCYELFGYRVLPLTGNEMNESEKRPKIHTMKSLFISQDIDFSSCFDSNYLRAEIYQS